MAHFSGTQDEQLMNTAEYIVKNNDLFNDPITRWSESFLNGGISNGTFRSLLDAQGIEPIELGQTMVPLEQVINHNSGLSTDNLQNQQLVNLGASQEELSETIQRQIDIRELQREEDQRQQEEKNALIAQQLEDLGRSVQDASTAANTGGFTSFLSGIGTGGLIAGGIVLFILLRKPF